MQIIKLSLDHYNFFCPATGMVIMDNETLNLAVPSLVAHWYDEDFLNPHLKEMNMRLCWGDYKSDFEEFAVIDPSLILNFLEQYQSKNYIAFVIEENASSSQGWNHSNFFVIDMNYSLSKS
jgi:hypothetical protein